MKELLMNLYNLNEEEYNKLAKRYSDKKIFEARWEFMIMEGKTRPVTSFVMGYYIEKHGDFLSRGKRLHHKIARAIYECMDAHGKVEVLGDIEFYKEEHNIKDED